MECSVEDCDKKTRTPGSGVCEMHYYRMRRTGTYSKVGPKSTGYCLQCGIELVGRRYGTLFCSQRCAVRSHRDCSEEPIACPMCGVKSLRPRNAIYCSRPCTRKASGLRENYGLQPEDYRALLKRFDHRCFICSASEDLVVDHDSTTGVVRGILCNLCNRGIGMMRHDKERLWRSIDYLTTYGDGAFQEDQPHVVDV